MFSDRQSLYIFKYERRCIEFANQPDEFLDELVARIVQKPVAYQGKSLARRPAEHNVDPCAAVDVRQLAQFFAGQADNGTRNNRCMRKIKVMRSGVNGIDLHGGGDVEACLLKTERHTADTRKQIDSYRPFFHR